jgi:hypothetical protein
MGLHHGSISVSNWKLRTKKNIDKSLITDGID